MTDANVSDAVEAPYVSPDVRAFLDFLNAQEGPKMHELPADATRAMMLAMREMADADPVPLAVVRDLTCPGPGGDIPLRLYDSRETRAAGPILIFYHGGGWVIGDIDTHEPFCTRAAELLDIPVLSVDYRLAPENPWPAGPDDCEAAARWAASSPAELGRGVTAITVAGDSAGGNLAIATAMALRDEPAAVPVIGQLLIYPSTDLAAEGGSMDEFADGHLLTKASMEWFRDHYAPDFSHQSVRPMVHVQSGMPPAILVTASLDPLRDQGRAFVEILQASAVPVTHLEAKGNIHGFICLSKAVPSAAQEITRMLMAFKTLIDEASA